MDGGGTVRTVLGVPLEAGERVLLLLQPKHTAVKATCIALGVVLAIAIFGVVLVAYGLFYDRWALRFVAVTNKRLVVKKGERPARAVDLADVVALRAKRPGGARLLAPAHALLDSRDALRDPAYWTTAELLLVQGRRGSLAIDRSADLAVLGPALARAAFEPGWVDRVPTALAPP